MACQFTPLPQPWTSHLGLGVSFLVPCCFLQVSFPPPFCYRIQCARMCVRMPRLVWLFATTWTVVARQAPLSMGFSRQKYWSGLPFPTPGYLPDPGTEPVSLTSPASAGGFFTSAPPRKPPLPHPPKKPSPFSWKIIQFSYVMVFSYRSLPSINFFRIFLMWKFLHLPTLGWWSFFFFPQTLPSFWVI